MLIKTSPMIKFNLNYFFLLFYLFLEGMCIELILRHTFRKRILFNNSSVETVKMLNGPSARSYLTKSVTCKQ